MARICHSRLPPDGLATVTYGVPRTLGTFLAFPDGASVLLRQRAQRPTSRFALE